MRGIGDNGGPPLDPEIDPNASWRHWCWKRAVKRAWKTPPREIALRRLSRAEALGITYRAYTLEILNGASTCSRSTAQCVGYCSAL